MTPTALLDAPVPGEQESGRIVALVSAFRSQQLDPAAFLAAAYDRLATLDAVAITVVDQAENQARLKTLMTAGPDLPLLGIPFVIKDNIDLAGVPTTAACPGFAYTPTESATVVERLLAAGALPIAKVNLDQFATGLVGTRSPYGIPANPVQPGKITGGSSSGSAVSVATGVALFSLGTDTAGSGRVPAGACNLIGLKPSKGRLSTRGVVPACRTLDCVSIFAESAVDAAVVAAVAGAFDDADPYSREPVLGQSLQTTRLGFLAGSDLIIDDPIYGDAYAAVQSHATAHGHSVVPTSYQVFADAAELLYGGPWVAERTAAVGDAIAAGIDGLDPTVSQIIAGGASATAVAGFQAEYAMAALRRQVAAVWEDIDVLVLPTVPGIPTVEAVAADPVAVNTRLGTYTNFVNLLDCSAIAMPVMVPGGLGSVTLVAPAWREDALLALVAAWHPELASSIGASERPVVRAVPPSIEDTAATLPLAVVGAHLTGQPLHGQLCERGAQLQQSTMTASAYKLYALPSMNGQSPKPAMVRDAAAGASQPVEVYRLPLSTWGSFMALIPVPLGIGQIELADGTWVHGFLADTDQLSEATDITDAGGWVAWLQSQA